MLRSGSSRLAICSTTLSPQLMQEALLRQGFVNVPQMTSCLDEWITNANRLCAHCYRLPLISSTKASGQRQCSARRPQRLRRSKAPASAKRPTPKLAEHKADWHPP